MPGFDGSGPMGMGPMTGGARGVCNPANAGVPVYGYGRGMAYRRGAGRGGFGPGRGLRRGFGAGSFPPAPAAYPPAYQYGAGNELDILKAQAESVKATLDQLNRRIAELEKDSDQ